MKTKSFIKAHGMWVVALLTAGITMSFQMASTNKTLDDIEYHYIGTDMGDQFNDLSNWSTTNNGVPCIITEDVLPCKITLPENVSLASELANKDNAQVLLRSEGYKQEN